MVEVGIDGEVSSLLVEEVEIIYIHFFIAGTGTPAEGAPEEDANNAGVVEGAVEVTCATVFAGIVEGILDVTLDCEGAVACCCTRSCVGCEDAGSEGQGASYQDSSVQAHSEVSQPSSCHEDSSHVSSCQVVCKVLTCEGHWFAVCPMPPHL